MMSENMAQKGFIGPKALFDPFYVPPKLLFRKQEESSLLSILNDSFKDNFSINILYQGIEGIGKKAIINKVFRDLYNSDQYFQLYKKIPLDCKEKSLEEIIISLISILSKYSNLDCEISTILNSNISKLWSILKLMCKKLDNHVIFIFYNSEFLETKIQKKFLMFGKNSNISIISTVNNLLRQNSLDIISDYDLKRKLDFFSYDQLISIFTQRTDLSFSYQVDRELIELITDLIFENYVPVPGKGINMLRDLYPPLKNKHSLDYDTLLKICENHFDSIHNQDEFNLLNYLAEEDLLTVLFLDNLINHFISDTSNYYINLEDLKQLYLISCESLEYNNDLQEFMDIITRLRNIGIISPSKKGINLTCDILLENEFSKNYYFLVLNPIKLKAMLDAIFSHRRFV
ncbi:MAG: hypothetical protein EU543_05975 [Promethearchaeota archaeon]|nr:MAG: hypothetical protein EU543_05975 [Candidatus Lokiarchaeota archaeon]